METSDRPSVYDGDDVLAWLEGSEARSVARRLATRLGLAGSNFECTEILADAFYGVSTRMQSPSPLVVGNPAAYGTTVIKHVIYAAARGRAYSERKKEAIERVGWIQANTQGLVGQTSENGVEDEVLDRISPDIGADADSVLRQMVETSPARKVWATSAALTYVTLLAHPDAYPDDVPRPKRGSTEEQSRCWAALWFAGQRDLFDPGQSGDAQRRRRQRYISDVLEYLQRTYGRYRLEAPK